MAQQVGERWAYREKAGAPVTPVRVVALGTKRPPRVRIRFLDEVFEGREEWVPPSRLKVPWAEVDGWLEREAKWVAVRAASSDIDPAEQWAASWALDRVGEDIVDVGYGRDDGLCRVLDVARLLELLDAGRSILDDDVAFVDDNDALVVPWAVTRRLAERAASRYAEALLAEADKEEKQARHDATYGRHHPSRSGDWFTPPEVCAQIDKEMWKPARAILRAWCGEPGRARHDELVALRAEVRRLGQLLEAAAVALHDVGLDRQAKALEDELGVPVDVLKQRRP